MYAHLWDLFLPDIERAKGICSIPYTWNLKEGRFNLIRSPSYVKSFRTLSILFKLHMAFVFWNLLQTLRNETNILLIMYGLGYTAITFAISVSQWMYQNQNLAGGIVELLNLTVDFEKLSTRPGTHWCFLCERQIDIISCAFINENVDIVSFQDGRTWPSKPSAY
jgi:hypothetical protein